MTRNDDSYDDELMPDSTQYVERAILFTSALFASAGLGGFAVARLSGLATLAPEVATIPHLLGLSVVMFSLGSGGFVMTFNLFTSSATFSQVKKVSSVYLPLVGLLGALVDAGAFHPRLAMVFICILCAFGGLYAMFRGSSILEFRRKNA